MSTMRAALGMIVAWTMGLTSHAAPGAQLPIELEVAAQANSPFGAMQKWHKVLAEMNLAGLRLRGAGAGDEPRLEIVDLAGVKRYRLTGMLNNRDELVLPGGKFRIGDRAQLKAYFDGLPAQQEEAGIERARFGLSRDHFAAVMLALARPVAVHTRDGDPQRLVGDLTRELDLAVAGSPSVRETLRGANQFRADMKGLTTGTALAAVLRGAGLQFAPERVPGQGLVLRVVRLNPAVESWPVGWAPLVSPRQAAPEMYRFTNIEIENYTLAAALEALAPHLGAPLVADQQTLAAKEIDLAAVQVHLPARKIYIRRAVDVILAQGRLAAELRVDEDGQPFLWVTQFGKDSPRATKIE